MSREIPTYNECYAFVILQNVAKIGNIQLSDKPDIISNNGNFGIEVVDARSEPVHKFNSEMANRHKNSAKKRRLPDGYCDHGNFYSGPILCSSNEIANDLNGFSTDNAINRIINMIRTKESKILNYRNCNCFDLFISTNLCVDEEEELKRLLYPLYTNYNTKFRTIYINVIDANKLVTLNNSGAFVKSYDKDQFDLAKKACSIERQYANK